MIQARFPRVIGHRGAAAHAPENTLASFQKAKDLGASWVELDVQLSADGVPVVFHDDALERTSNGQGPLCGQTLEQLSRLDAGAWFAPAFSGQCIPALAQAITMILSLGLGLNIEIKADEDKAAPTAQAALAVAQSLWPADRTPPLISSFAESALTAAATDAPSWPRALLVGGVPKDAIQRLKRLGCVSLNADYRQLTPSNVHDIKAAGLGILAYTVNHPAQAERLWQWGVDGLFSDVPDRLLHTIA